MKSRTFKRHLDSLESIYEFTSSFFAEHGIDPGLLPAVDLIVEELFSNIVEHSTSSDADVPMEMRRVDDGVEVSLTDQDVDPFDVTKTPEVDVDRPIGEFDIGGLGLHLVKKFADSIEYQYEYKNRCSRIIFRKTKKDAASSPQPKEGRDV